MSHLIALSLALVCGAIPITPATWPVAFPYDDGSWKAPLQQKAGILHQMAIDRHDIDGLYPSQVSVIDGQVNLTTSGHADVSHSLNWTTALFVGEVYHWKLTQDPAVYEYVKRLFYGIDRCQRVNGVPGVISRGYVFGHGPSYEERRGDGRGQERWFQGEGEYANYRWRGNPSHHNHSGFYRAMGLAWLMIDDPDIRQRVKENVTEVTRRVFLENDMRVLDFDGVESATLLWGKAERPSMPGLFVTSELKVASEITQDPAIIRYYEKMIDRLKYREYAQKSPQELMEVIDPHDYDDTEHCFQHLDTMRLMETDPELIQFYKNFAEAMWLVHKDDKQPFYNVMYHAVTGNDGKAEDVLWWLKHYPTNKYFQPRMSSTRPGAASLPKPLPLSERPFDNEYDFKGDPYRLDGWVARFITDVEGALIDPQVLFACDDSGRVYRSLDGGQSWANSYLGLGGASARAVLPSPREVEVVLAATDRGLFRSRDCGYTWTRVLDIECSALMLDPKDSNAAYAVAGDGVYESVPFDSESWGYTWRKTGGDGPPLPVQQYFLAEFEDGVRFLAQDERNTLWISQPGAEAWSLLNRPFGGRYTFTAISSNKGTLLALAPGAKAIAISQDGGQNWRPAGRQISWEGEDGGLKDVTAVAALLDPADPQTVYVAGADWGLWTSRDAGKTWEPAQAGMDIPVVNNLMACRADGRVYAGTRGGLCWTSDGGKTWRRGNLAPQFDGVQLIETGPADYIEAYWLARYHGMITEEQAVAPWQE